MHRYSLYTLLLLLFVGCKSDDDNNGSTDSFDRGEMLTHWADDIIIPAYRNYNDAVTEMNVAITELVSEPSIERLSHAKATWETAYKVWQNVGSYNIGPSETYDITEFTNLYPTSSQLIDINIDTGEYDLAMPSQKAAQGFPAIEYLLYNADDSQILTNLNEDTGYGTYLLELSQRITTLSSLILTEWDGEYRASFIENSGSSLTSSVDKVANDFVYYYEKHIRAAKVGIPAGVFSNGHLPNTVEGKYANGISKELLLLSLDHTENFFLGKSSSTDPIGPGLYTYLSYLEKADIGDDILSHIATVKATASLLDDDFEVVAETNPTALLQLYDQLQAAVVLMKVDMMQTLNISIDYVDADGD